MTPDPLKRPNPFQRPQKPSKAKKVPPPNTAKSPPSGGGKNSDDNEPSPWLKPQTSIDSIDTNASFVEYLRWMRSPDLPQKDPTKVQILQMAEERSGDRDRLKQLNRRTERIAGKANTFQVKCPWRIRVGGHRGPESILLPTFDALGTPFIPSSTLRGVARTQAIRETMKRENLTWSQAEQRIARYFGALDAPQGDRAGKVVFLDAYPLPGQAGLAVDMANNIWSWNDSTLDYNPKPNPFLSLQQPTFLIGLRLASTCHDPQVLERVKQWLIAGLQQGIGSQVNAGYGELAITGAKSTDSPLFQVAFALKGQLIHGRQKFTQWRWNDKRNEWQMRGQPDPEVRPVAFKSMLRYWLRTFALGVLSPSEVQQLEAQLFGNITPARHGWLRVKISRGNLVQPEPRPNDKGKNDRCGEQEGTLALTRSSEAPDDSHAVLKQLCQSLTWMMFHLGGIGQGARRPCYSRKSRERAPWYRGSTLIPDSEDDLWELPPSVNGFRKKFQQQLHLFYQAIAQLGSAPNINSNQPNQVGEVRRKQWTEAVDRNCQIVVCSGEEEFNKPYALAVLHDPELKVQNRRGQEEYDGNLCGQVRGGVKPSPVWIANFGDYQVVTVFGANVNPRKKYLRLLREDAEDFARIFPFN